MIVVGAGIVGCAIAREAADAGMHVLVVSDQTPGHGTTATGMGHIVVMDDNESELALSLLSRRLWESLREPQKNEFSQCGTLWVATNDGEATVLGVKASRLREAGIECDLIEAQDITRIEPNLHKRLAGALRVPSDAVVYAPNVARYLLNSPCAIGSILFRKGKVVSVDRGRVDLSDSTVLRASHTVIAAGVASRALIPELKLIPRKGHLAITERYPGLIQHQIMEVGYAASAHGATQSVAFNVQPRPTGQILIGSSRQPGVATRESDASVVSSMLQRAASFIEKLNALRVLRIWTGLRPGTHDGAPYIGAWPNIEGCWIATGHEGLGITTALGTATLLLDQLLGRPPTLDPSPYLPSRLIAANEMTA